MRTMKIETIGKVVDKIPVKISYKIIELFSAGLYSSPNKAFEELVSNSYDAGATKVAVRVDIKSDLNFEDSILWVCDNGEGMNLDGLKLFWKIGSSKKARENEVRIKHKHNRLAIGKFGIGKLATYILTKKLTIISKTSQGYYAVTMNYENISKTSIDGDDSELTLDERKLTLQEVKLIIEPIIKQGKEKLLEFELWGNNSERSWTFAIMSDLKVKAKEIAEGRLKYILRTALPLNPNFNLSYNGVTLKSSRNELVPMKIWTFGKDDKVVNKFSKEYTLSKYNNLPAINSQDLKNVTGQIELYKESFLKDSKSEKWGRSHGVFLMVRERLINIDDALLGIPPLSHGVFNRVRIMVNADDLDSHITSTRESIIDSPKIVQLKKYIQRKFSEVKDYYFDSIHDEETKSKTLYKISQSQSSLSRLPILNGVRKFVEGKITSFHNTRFPNDLSKSEMTKLVSNMQHVLMTEEGFIQNISWESLGIDYPIAILDIGDAKLKINPMHPFCSSFIEENNFELIAVSEVLHEFHLHEFGLNQETVLSIMQKRDDTFRDLAFGDKLSAPVVGLLLKSTLTDPSGLESSVTHAFNSLGFEAKRIGGKGKPDGLAMARIGPLKSADRYSITYDTKSTKKDSIKAITAHISGVKRHQADYKADYSCVIATDFEGSNDPNSAINSEAKANKVSLITATDLAALVILAGPKQLSLKKFREFFQTCYTTFETAKWIEDLKNEVVEQGPIKELLNTIYKLYDDDFEPASLSALRHNSVILKKMNINELRALVQSLVNLVPNYIGLNGDIVSINVSPATIIQKLRSVTSEVPLDFREHYLKAYGQKKLKSKKKFKGKSK